MPGRWAPLPLLIPTRYDRDDDPALVQVSLVAVKHDVNIQVLIAIVIDLMLYHNRVKDELVLKMLHQQVLDQ